MLAVIDENTNIVWLCSPNNPTGTYIPEQKLVAFLEKVPAETLVVLDEPIMNMLLLKTIMIQSV